MIDRKPSSEMDWLDIVDELLLPSTSTDPRAETLSPIDRKVQVSFTDSMNTTNTVSAATISSSPATVDDTVNTACRSILRDPLKKRNRNRNVTFDLGPEGESINTHKKLRKTTVAPKDEYWTCDEIKERKRLIQERISEFMAQNPSIKQWKEAEKKVYELQDASEEQKFDTIINSQ